MFLLLHVVKEAKLLWLDGQNRSDTNDSRPGAYDQKFAVLTPLVRYFLSFAVDREKKLNGGWLLY